MLAIRCQFLQGTYQAAAPGRLSEPEWPPHPARLHAALVASAWAVSDSDELPVEQVAVLRWLEQLPPPALSVPAEAEARTLAPVYVPRNLTGREMNGIRGHLRRGKLDAARRDMGRVDRVFPTRVPGDEPVWFIWEDAAPDSALQAVLDRIVGEVQYLGSSRSPVCCAVTGDPPPPTHVPTTESGTEALRVAGKGLTDALVASRAEPAQGHMRRRVASYGPPANPERQGLQGPFGRLLILERQAGFALTIQHTILVTKALRRAMLARAGDDAPALLHGHGRHPHAAFLALANVGNEHSTGELLGLAVAVPRNADEEDEAGIVKAADSVSDLTIHESIAPWTVARRSADQQLRTLDPARWVGPSRHWRTATPVILDRHPKRSRGETVEHMVTESFANALLPSPVRVRVSRFPFLPGAVAAAMHAGHGTPAGLALHAEVSFSAPVRGPVLVGRGRYFGVGLLSPYRPRRDGR